MEEKSHFARDATGLVKELNWWDSFALGYGAIAVAVGIPVVYYIINATLAGADIYLSLLLLLPIGVFTFTLTYMMVGMIYPRDALDYVVNSRLLHPSIGFAISWFFIATYLTTTAVFADLTTTSFLPGFLNAIGQSGISTALATTMNRAIVDIVIIILGGLMTLASLRTFARIQTICVLTSILSVVLMLGVLFYLASTGFETAYNSAAGNSTAYSSIISSAQSGGFTQSFSWGATLLAVPALLYFVIGTTPAGLVGEMRTVKKSLTYAMIGAGSASWILLLLFAALYYNVLGSDFAHSLAFLAYNNPSASPFGSSPSLTSILAYVYPNGSVNALISLGIMLATFLIVPQTLLYTSRVMFSWSFDRLLPMKFAEVSRFRTPWVTAITALLVAIIVLLFYVFTGLVGALLNASLMLTPLAIGIGISAALIPYRAKAAFEAAPAFVRMKIGPVPVISIIGIINALGLAFFTVAVAVFPQIGYPLSFLNVEFIIGWLLLGFVLFFVSKSIRNRQGLDLSVSFREIPPE